MLQKLSHEYDPFMMPYPTQVIGSALNTTLNSTGMGTYDSAPVLSALMSSINLNNLTNSVLAALAPFNSPAPPPSNASKNSTSSMMGASNSTWGALGSVNMTAAAMAAVMAARSSIAGAINGTTALGSGVSGAVTQVGVYRRCAANLSCKETT
jgi:hypothetical protein